MEKEKYKKLAIESFNKTWQYIDKENKTSEDIEEMIKLAHSSRHYWVKAGGTELNKQRGDWMISHVYCLTGNGKEALVYAKKCYDRTIKENFKDFDLVFAYEAMAHSYKVLNDDSNKDIYLKKGYEAIEQVEKKEDKDYCKSQLDLI